MGWNGMAWVDGTMGESVELHSAVEWSGVYGRAEEWG